MKEKIDYLVNEMKKINIDLSESQIQQFMKYYEMLVEWNKVMNLTGITEFKEVVMKHFVDSVIIDQKLVSQSKTMIDIGTGAGFPGIPLKIVYPHLNVTLLDSLNKRINFLNSVISEIGLENIETIHGRAEDFAKKEQYREQFDLCVSRAVANLATLSEYCIPYVKVNGYFAPYKSGNISEEIEMSKFAVNLLGGKMQEIDEFMLPGTDIARSIVKIKKYKNTGKKFPRKAGLPTKEPIMK